MQINSKFKLIILSIFTNLAILGQTNQSAVSGTLVDKASKYPIVSATIVLRNDSLNYSTKSDTNGFFLLKNVMPNRYEIIVSSIGYSKINLSGILITSGKEETFDLEMEEKVGNLKSVVIRGRKREVQNEMSTVSSRSFSMEEVNRYSGGRGDPARLASNFAGVSAPNDQRNDLVIRGNSPIGVLWRLEGINVPNLNHFSTLSTTGGPVSALNTNVLRNSDFMTSAFPSEYGNATAGVFDIGMRRGNSNKHEFTLQMSAFTGVEAMAEGPINKKSGSSYLVAYRYSFAGFAKTAGLDIGTAATPYYQDLTFKLNGAKTKFGQFSFFGIGALSSINFLHNEIDSSDIFADPNRDSKVKSRIGVVGLSHNIALSQKANLKTTIGATYTGNDYYEDSISKSNELPINNLIVENKEIHYVLNTVLNAKINSKLSLKSGCIAELYDIDVLTRTRKMRPDWLDQMDYEDKTLLTQSYFQFKYNFNQQWSTVIGVHAQLLTLNQSFAIEPRASLKYTSNGYGNFTFGYGMHHQMQPLTVYFFQAQDPSGAFNVANRNLGFTRSHHFVVGHDYLIQNDWKIKTEAYMQYLENVPVELSPSSFSLLNEGASFAPTQKYNLTNAGSGINKGIEITIEKYFTKNYYGLLTASLYDSKYKGSDGLERNTAFNGSYTLNVLGGKEFKVGKNKNNAITFDTKFTFAGGRYYTPIDINASRIKGEEVLSGDNLAFTEKYPEYYRWDVKFGYRMNGKNKKISHMLFFDLQNITFRKNIFALRYNTVTQNVNTAYQNGFFPNFLYRIQF